jgi:putative transposase
VHFYRNVWTAVPTSKVKEVAAMRKVIRVQEDRAAARQKAEQVAAKLKEMKLADAAEHLRTGIEETLFYCTNPREHWRSLQKNKTNNRWNDCCAECGEQHERWAHFRMESRR